MGTVSKPSAAAGQGKNRPQTGWHTKLRAVYVSGTLAPGRFPCFINARSILQGGFLMDLAELTTRAASAVAGGDSGFSKKVKFDFGDVGKLFIDGTAGVANNDDAEADATVKVDWEDFGKLAAGQLDPTMAFMQGKLKVLGDMSVAMQLQSIMSKLS
jgi:putative sterol carrier protein